MTEKSSSRFCNCCLSAISRHETSVQVTEEIRRKFFELVQVEMKTNSQSICQGCDEKLAEFSVFRCEILRLMGANVFFKVETETEVKVEYESDLDWIQHTEETHEKEESLMQSSKTSRNLKSFSCEICPDSSWRSQRSLGRHMKAKHGKSMAKEKFPFVNLCPICARLIKGGKYRFDEHMLRSHSDDYHFFCDLCPRKFKQVKDIRRHVMSHIQKKFREKFPCESCGLEFTAKPRLELHVFMNHAENPRIFNCDCGKSFKTKLHLNIHVKTMHNLGSFPCELCETRVFPTKPKLDRHIREFHAEKKPCEVCGKLISGVRTMAKHMIGHGDPLFKCTYEGCDKEFFGKLALKDHVAMKHERIESFICPNCGSAFATNKNMKKHIQRQHTSMKIACAVDGCKHFSNRKDYLARHYRSHKDIDEIKKLDLIASIKDIPGITW